MADAPPQQAANATVPATQAKSPPLPFAVWLFVRLIVPTGPILIQYGLKFLGLYDPPFPQPTYVTLLFSLSLATVTEYRDVRAIIYGCMVPAIGACVLYTVYVMKIDAPAQNRPALLAGFYLWIILLLINFVRAGWDGLRRYFGVRD